MIRSGVFFMFMPGGVLYLPVNAVFRFPRHAFLDFFVIRIIINVPFMIKNSFFTRITD